MACAESRNVTALYALDGGEYVSYILGAPEFVNEDFRALFADGVPALTPLTVKSDGPATAAPLASAVTGPWATCLQGEIAVGFNLVVYEGGSVDELVACAEGAGLAAVYALNDGIWVSYTLGAPEFVNAAFRELFIDGVPPSPRSSPSATDSRLRGHGGGRRAECLRRLRERERGNADACVGSDGRRGGDGHVHRAGDKPNPGRGAEQRGEPLQPGGAQRYDRTGRRATWRATR